MARMPQEPYVRARSSTNYIRCTDVLHRPNLADVETVWESPVVSSSTINGWTNPFWKSLLVEHQAGTNCTGKYMSTDGGYVEFSQRYVQPTQPAFNTGFSYYGSVNGPDYGVGQVTSTPAVPSSLRNVALARFYSSIEDKIGQFKGLTFLGELSETVKMLKSPFKSLRDLAHKREEKLWRQFKPVRKYESGPRKELKLKQLREAAADSWLETMFGLSPLVSDIEALIDHFQQRQNLLYVEFLNVKGKAIQKVVSTQIGGDQRYSYHYGMPHKLNWRTESRMSYRYRGMLRVDPITARFSGDFRALGFTLREFVPTLVELTPWSFLFDYVSNFSTVVNSISLPLRDLVWIIETIRSDTVRYIDLSPNQTQGRKAYLSGYVEQLGCNQLRPFKSTYRTWTRTVLDPFTLPTPSFQFEVPSFKQVVNMYALTQTTSRERFSQLG